VLIVHGEGQILNLLSGIMSNKLLKMKLFKTIKKIVSPSILLLYLFELHNVVAQGQVNMTDYLSQKFRRYCELVPREEVFASCDREEYISGEELWFSIWLVDRQTSHASLNSRIVYLELLNPENKPVVQKRIRIDRGCGHGQIELPDTLTTGMYTIRAYTNWMKNFLPFNCFMKDIKIFNAFRSRSFRNKVYEEEDLKSGYDKNKGIGMNNKWLTLKVNNLKPDTLEIFVDADEKYLTNSDNLFYMLIQTHGIINFAVSQRFNSENSKISISKKILIPGINQVILFDSKGQPVCERYLYTPDMSKKNISVRSEDGFNKRSKVSLELFTPDSASAELSSTNFSISVTPVPYESRGMKLNEYMIFGSEFGLFPGKIIKDKRMDEVPQKLIDSLLSNIKSNWIDWKSILKDSLPEFKFQFENENHYLTGTLNTSDNQHAWPGEFLLLSIPRKVPLFEYSTTNFEGKFSFNINLNEGVQDLLIQSDNVSKNYRIYFESSFSDEYLPSGITVDSISKPLIQYISNLSRNYQVSKIYGYSSTEPQFMSGLLSQLTLKRFYGKPDAEIIMKDWVNLSSMEEVFFEIVPHIKLKKKGSSYEILLIDPLGKILYDTPPVTMIDGVIIKDPAIIVNINPGNVEKIDVVKEQYMVGDYLFNGIVNIITKSGDLSNISVPDYLVRMQYKVFDTTAVFISPEYSAPEMKSRHEPDFRNTLYWNPSLKSGLDGKAKIEFWTSDIKTDYEINVIGVSPEGKTLSFNKIIKIR
jgi:hypothetical protein